MGELACDLTTEPAQIFDRELTWLTDIQVVTCGTEVVIRQLAIDVRSRLIHRQVKGRLAGRFSILFKHG